MAVLGSALASVADTPREVTVDAEGVLRWKDSGQEAAFFGVNYMTPFTYTYRAIGYVGASREETIRNDVLHLSRIGINALRVVAWECEISDAEGNLTPNEHLHLLDFLIAECRKRGIYVLLTPIFWGGNGYPEADEPIKGFSLRFAKRDMGRDPAAVAATKRYLTQFVSHVNPFTQLAYKEDPTVVAIELSNEPWAPPADILTGYINGVTEAIRETGCRKPLFFCVSQGAKKEQTDAIGASNVEGVTFGWYPSGLVSDRTLPGNYLPLIDEYPLMQDAALQRKTKFVYEFDAADLGSAFMYPAFARTFRTNGVQWATQFVYSPLPLAGTNTAYQTHFMNLIYAPRQAMSLMIAAEAFRTLPRNAGHGRYPENTRFGAFRVDYAHDVSEMATETALLYSNDTKTAPPKPEKLERIAGWGSSPVVDYEGTGCYFLNRQAPGVWRLEVYPDAIWTNDPHGAPRLDREASRILWREWPMTVRLPDLGGAFQAEAVNTGNTFHSIARNGHFSIRPGVYRLRRANAADAAISDTEFLAPPETANPTALIHHPPLEARTDAPLRIVATIASSSAPDEVTVRYRFASGDAYQTLPMKRVRGFVYAADIPAARLRPGVLSYVITTQIGGETRSFPSGQPVTIKGVASSAALFDGASAGKALRLTAAQEVAVVPTGEKGTTEGEALLVEGRSLGVHSAPLTVTLVTKDGKRYSAFAPLTPEGGTQRIPLSTLHPAEGWIMLRRPTAETLATIQFSLPADVEAAEIARVAYGPLRETWETLLRSPDAPLVLFDPARDEKDLLTFWPSGAEGQMTVISPQKERPAAFAVTVRKFGKPAEFGARYLLDDRWNARRPDFSRYESLRLRLRATRPATKQLRFSLIDRDGQAWTAIISVGMDWQEVTLPLRSFRPALVTAIPMGYPTAVTPVPPPLSVAAMMRAENLMAWQFSLTPSVDTPNAAQGIEIESITLERGQQAPAGGYRR